MPLVCAQAHFLLVQVLFAYAFCPALFLRFFSRAVTLRASCGQGSFDGPVMAIFLLPDGHFAHMVLSEELCGRKIISTIRTLLFTGWQMQKTE